MTTEKLLYQGAESKIFLMENFVVKRRIKKGYRIPEIDERLRKLRTRSEAKIMQRLEGKINLPKIIKVDENSKEIIMQYIQGKKLSDFLDSFPINKQLELCKEIGKEVAKIHDLNIIHSDLTTSNMILVEGEDTNKKPNKTIKKMSNSLVINKTTDKTNKTIKPMFESSFNLSDVNNSKLNSSEVGEQEEPTKEGNYKIYFIDFGLSFHSLRIEDKAVDLHLLKQALESRHFQNWEKLFKAVLEGYNPKDKEKILKQLEKVEERGRYKH